MNKTLLAAALAFAPIPAHANYIEIVNGEVMLGIGLPHITSGIFDLANPDWSFENDPNWGTEIVPCPLVPWIHAEYAAWEMNNSPSAPASIDTPLVDVLSPIVLQPLYITPFVTPITTPIPETSTWVMGVIGFACLGFSIFRQRLATVSQWRRV